MKSSALLLIVVLACPAQLLAQQPTGKKTSVFVYLEERRDDREVVLKKEMEHPIIFWTGLALLAVGVTSLVGSATWSQDSDLSNEFQSVRLGRDLAPCGTDPGSTKLPIADCKLNDGLAWIGGGLAAVGGGMMVFGGTQIEVVQRRSLVLASIKF